MTITPKTLLLALAAAAVLILGFSFLSPSSPPSPSFSTKEAEAGNVTVSVTHKQLSVGAPPVFDLAFDTHSVNLDFDVAAAATLTDDQGNAYGTPIWSGDPPGGHHRKGTLSFPDPLKQATRITLMLKDIANTPERKFIWNVSTEGGDTK